jgi:hypothetical protein
MNKLCLLFAFLSLVVSTPTFAGQWILHDESIQVNGTRYFEFTYERSDEDTEYLASSALVRFWAFPDAGATISILIPKENFSHFEKLAAQVGFHPTSEEQMWKSGFRVERSAEKKDELAKFFSVFLQFEKAPIPEYQKKLIIHRLGLEEYFNLRADQVSTNFDLELDSLLKKTEAEANRLESKELNHSEASILENLKMKIAKIRSALDSH